MTSFSTDYSKNTMGMSSFGEMFGGLGGGLFPHRSFVDDHSNLEFIDDISTCASDIDEDPADDPVEDNLKQEETLVVRTRYSPIKNLPATIQKLFSSSKKNDVVEILRNPSCECPFSPLNLEEAQLVKNFICAYDMNPFKKVGTDIHISRVEARRFKNLEIPFSLTKTSKNEWIVHLKTKRGPKLGVGSFKVVKTGLVFFKGETVASATVRENPHLSLSDMEQEMAIGKQIQGIPGLVGIRAFYHYTSKKLEKKIGFIMDYYNGGDMESLKIKLSAEERLKVVERFLLGLKNLHAKKIWHRDIKVENIVVKKKLGKVDSAITDFGFSVPHGSTSNKYQGTPYCMAPELYPGTSRMTFASIGEKSDVYSAGLAIVTIMEDIRFLPSVFYEKDVGKHIAKMNRLPNMNFHHIRRIYMNCLDKMRTANTGKHTNDTVLMLAANCLEILPSNRPSAQELYTDFMRQVRKVTISENSGLWGKLCMNLPGSSHAPARSAS